MTIRTIISFVCSFFSMWQKWKFVIFAITPIVISAVCPSGAVLRASQEAGLCGLDLLDALCLVSAWLEQGGAAAHQSAACSQSSRVLCLSVSLSPSALPSLYVYLCMCAQVCATTYAWKSEDRFQCQLHLVWDRVSSLLLAHQGRWP